MAQPSGNVVLGEEEAPAAEQCLVALEAELQALRQRNKELMHGLQEQ